MMDDECLHTILVLQEVAIVLPHRFIFIVSAGLLLLPRKKNRIANDIILDDMSCLYCFKLRPSSVKCLDSSRSKVTLVKRAIMNP
jgi:hypothetical protein